MKGIYIIFLSIIFSGCIDNFSTPEECEVRYNPEHQLNISILNAETGLPPAHASECNNISAVVERNGKEFDAFHSLCVVGNFMGMDINYLEEGLYKLTVVKEGVDSYTETDIRLYPTGRCGIPDNPVFVDVYLKLK